MKADHTPPETPAQIALRQKWAKADKEAKELVAEELARIKREQEDDAAEQVAEIATVIAEVTEEGEHTEEEMAEIAGVLSGMMEEEQAEDDDQAAEQADMAAKAARLRQITGQ